MNIGRYFYSRVSILTVYILLTTGFSFTVSNTSVAADFSAPVILLPFSKPLYDDARPYNFVARVTDDNGVDEVVLHFRGIGTNKKFNVIILEATDDPDIYSGTISKEFIFQPGLEYYIEARDVANNISQEPFSNLPRQILFSIIPESQKIVKQPTSWWWMALGVVATGLVANELNKDDEPAAEKGESATLIIDTSNPDPNN